MAAPMLGGHDAAATYGSELRRLRSDRQLTQDALARRMGYERSTVAHVEAGRKAPTEEFTRLAEAALDAKGALLDRWHEIDDARNAAAPTERDLHVTDCVAWLADHSDLSFEGVYAAVAAEAEAIEREPASVRHARQHARSRTGRADVAQVLADFYGPDGFYQVDVEGKRVQLGVLSKPDWLRAVELGGDAERARYVWPASPEPKLDLVTAQAAVRTLAAAEAANRVLENRPLYRLVDVGFTDGLDVAFTTVPFAEYALGTNMLESEAEAAAAGGDMPLRRLLLPDTASIYDLASRPACGGLTGLVAIARRDGDYAVFTHERSGRVVNGGGQIATIPQAFHQPTAEDAGEVKLSMTLTRELEEELLGRDDLEDPDRAGDALHDQAASAPLQWLREHPGSLRTEVTGLCLNAGGGNYVFACLVVIDDPTWWDLFGHQVQANWEAARIVRHSTRDTGGLARLIHSPRWADIGLFTFLQGLRRLGEVGDAQRMALPAIEKS